MSSVPVGAQFGRKANLLLLSKSGKGLDLSNMHFKFDVKYADFETPNIAVIRVYNLSNTTQQQALKEFDFVTLQAGYASQFGIIFSGSIKQFYRGRESNTDSFLEIRAADADPAYNFGFVNVSVAAGSTAVQRAQTIAGESTDLQLDANSVQNLVQSGGILPRGKVMFGLSRVHYRNLAASNNMRWSIQNGLVKFIPLNSYNPDQQIILVNSSTGMTGIPEATDNGITVQTLLNPLIKIGSKIRLNNKDVTATILKEQFYPFPSYTSGITRVANSQVDGDYCVLVADHIGDTRGQDWHTNIVCLAIDKSSNKIQPFG
jgi:hypothetical protein